MAGGELGNHVSTSLAISRVLYMFKKLVMPLATTSPATESPGKIAAKLCADGKVAILGPLQRICKQYQDNVVTKFAVLSDSSISLKLITKHSG